MRFFCEDVYRVWQRWNERVGGSIRSGLRIVLDLKQPAEALNSHDAPMSTQEKGKRKREALGKGGVEGVDVGYSELKGHLEKSIFMLEDDEPIMCSICAARIGPDKMVTLVCSQESCRTASHMTCLATRFLDEEGAGSSIMPTSGKCPKCKVALQWIDLIKEMSLRARGEKEVAQLMKRPKGRQSKAVSSHIEHDHTRNEDESDQEGGNFGEIALQAGSVADDPLPDDWHYQEDDENDLMSTTSAASDGMDSASSLTAPRLEVVIEDSDWDEAEVLD